MLSLVHWLPKNRPSSNAYFIYDILGLYKFFPRELSKNLSYLFSRMTLPLVQTSPLHTFGSFLTLAISMCTPFFPDHNSCYHLFCSSVTSEDGCSVDLGFRVGIEAKGFYTENFHSAAWVFRGDDGNPDDSPRCLSKKPRPVAGKDLTIMLKWICPREPVTRQVSKVGKLAHWVEHLERSMGMCVCICVCVCVYIYRTS